MKKRSKILIIALLFSAIGFMVVYRFVYNKPHPDYAKEEAVANLSAKDLYNGFKSATADFNHKYNGKVIAVRGMVTKIEKSDSLVVAVFVFEQGDFGDQGVRCTLLPVSDGSLNRLKPESEITIKGLCNGYNETDVILEKCTIIQ